MVKIEGSFRKGVWLDEINVRDFILNNYTPYEGDDSFLKPPTFRTQRLWEKCKELLREEQKKNGVLAIDTDRVATITSHGPGYICKEDEVIVGLQTDEPLKRPLNVFGGLRMAVKAANAYGYEVNPNIIEFFEKYRTTHNDGVFSTYTDQMLKLRKYGILTGLPDAYGRGRIIGDYRRVALYGIDRLIAEKEKDFRNLDTKPMDIQNIQLREEISKQIKALKDLKIMAGTYGYDISKPAQTAKEAVQWLYFAYLAAIKEQNGAAMSLGRVSTFLDIYIENDIQKGLLSEEEAQELIDQFVIKLRLARQLRTPEYNELFSGDPLWVTEAVGGMALDGRPLVSKTSFRFLNTLINLGPAPEPNITILWSENLPENFKKYVAKVSIKTSSLQYENDDIMRPIFGDDYGIACCVSAMRIGKQMQFFGARANLAKALLLIFNEGRDEITGDRVMPPMFPAPQKDAYLDFDTVWERYSQLVDWLAEQYVNTMNIIHYMHDKYAYENIEMALHDTDVDRLIAFGLAGLSVVADSLSAIKYGKVKPVFDERGIVCDFEVEKDFPKFGNNDDRVDEMAVAVIKLFNSKLKKYQTYRNAHHTLSVLTITSNIVYGKRTGTTPDKREKGAPFAPGANPLHGRDVSGVIAFLSSVAKLPYEDALDGISCTFSIVPKALGHDEETRINNLAALLEGYFKKHAHHLNVNVIDRETLMDAMEHPENYPQLTIRVSGYAVNFVKLTREQQLEVLARTFHEEFK